MWQIHASPRYRRPSCTVYIQWTQNWNLIILKGILWSSGLTCVGYHALRNAKAIQFSESTKVGGRNLSWAPPLPGASQISTHGCLKQNNIWPYMDSQSCIHLYGCCFIHPQKFGTWAYAMGTHKCKDLYVKFILGNSIHVDTTAYICLKHYNWFSPVTVTALAHLCLAVELTAIWLRVSSSSWWRPPVVPLTRRWCFFLLLGYGVLVAR